MYKYTYLTPEIVELLQIFRWTQNEILLYIDVVLNSTISQDENVCIQPVKIVTN